MRFLLAIALACAMATTAIADGLVERLQESSVTVNSGQGQGSGSIVTRKIGEDTYTFVWTAAHVVDNLRTLRTVVDPKTGTSKTIVEFSPAKIVQEFRQDGRMIGEVRMEATVIRYSDSETGEDLALLMVRQRNFKGSQVTTEFFLEDKIPDLGTELYHVGSLHGQVGSNSLTTGVVSQVGRVFDLNPNGVVFDQTTVTAFPGSSGGGVYQKEDGKYIGMLVRGGEASFNFIVPIRRMKAWAEHAHVAWAIDPSVPMPTLSDIKKLPIEDAGMPESMADQLNRGKKNESQPDGFKFLLWQPQSANLFDWSEIGD